MEYIWCGWLGNHHVISFSRMLLMMMSAIATTNQTCQRICRQKSVRLWGGDEKKKERYWKIEGQALTAEVPMNKVPLQGVCLRVCKYVQNSSKSFWCSTVNLWVFISTNNVGMCGYDKWFSIIEGQLEVILQFITLILS